MEPVQLLIYQTYILLYQSVNVTSHISIPFFSFAPHLTQKGLLAQKSSNGILALTAIEAPQFEQATV
jgi:hypothetical protein